MSRGGAQRAALDSNPRSDSGRMGQRQGIEDEQGTNPDFVTRQEELERAAILAAYVMARRALVAFAAAQAQGLLELEPAPPADVDPDPPESRFLSSPHAPPAVETTTSEKDGSHP